MIEPRNITNYHRTTDELEEFLLFCVFVQGKKAQQTAEKLEKFLDLARRDLGKGFGAQRLTEAPSSPFALIKDMLIIEAMTGINELDRYLRHCKFGCYRNLNIGLRQLIKAKLDLRTCTTADLEAIHGIGMKSSRFFLMHSREDQQIATLDTHILSWLRDIGYEAPKSTPTNPRLYYRLENAFLMECRARGMKPADLDLALWKERQVQ